MAQRVKASSAREASLRGRRTHELVPVYLAMSAGVFAHERPLVTALILAPGLAFSLIAIGCSWVVFLYFRAECRAEVEKARPAP